MRPHKVTDKLPLMQKISLGGVEFDLKLVFVIVLTTVVPMLDHYGHSIVGVRAYDRLIFYFLIPITVIHFLFRERLSDYGFQIGKWREGAMWTVGVCLVIGLFLLWFARTPAMEAYYTRYSYGGPLQILHLSAVDLFGWEFVWRGFLLFAYARYFGAGPAIFLQAVPFAFMHLGKPELETLSTILGGAGFGFVAWRTQSFVYGWLIHWFMVVMTMLTATGQLPFLP